MKRRTMARLIAVLLLGYLFALWLSGHNGSEIAHYRTLDRDALIAELAKKTDTSFDTAFFVGVFLIGAAALSIDAVGAVVLLAMNRISPVHPGVTTDLDGERDDDAPRFH